MPRDAISTTNATSTAGSTDSETMKGADTTKAMTMIMRVRRLGEILITIDGRRLGDHRLGETPITNDARRDARRLDEILITMDRRDLEVVATSTTCVTPIAIAFDGNTSLYALRAKTRAVRALQHRRRRQRLREIGTAQVAAVSTSRAGRRVFSASRKMKLTRSIGQTRLTALPPISIRRPYSSYETSQATRRRKNWRKR